MPRIAYVDGAYGPLADAHVHVEDRGFQFADGVYEVIAYRNGAFVDERGHFDRLWRSMSELRMAPPMGREAMQLVMREVTRRNRFTNGIVYIQVTRGAGKRDFKFPKDAHSTLVMTARPMDLTHQNKLETGVKVVTTPDQRWTRRDIKTVGLLAQVLAKQTAAEAGAFEAWMVDPDGFVTEGSSSNAWILTNDGRLVTRHADNMILRGVTRTALHDLAQRKGITVEERPFTVEESYRAREAFVSSATSFLMPVVQIDDQAIGNGVPGSLGADLRRAYLDYTARGSDAELPWVA